MLDIIDILVKNEYDVDLRSGRVIVLDPVFTSTNNGLVFSHYNFVQINSLAQACNFIEERN